MTYCFYGQGQVGHSSSVHCVSVAFHQLTIEVTIDLIIYACIRLFYNDAFILVTGTDRHSYNEDEVITKFP